MNKNKITAIFTIFVLGIVSFTYVYKNLWGFNFNKKEYKLFVEMNDGSNLSLGTPVLMNGVKIGKVQDIYLESNNVIFVLIIQKNVKVPLGSAVRISYKGLIGDLLVNIFRSTNNEFYEDGDKIKGEGPISPNVVLEKMTKIASQLEIITEDIAKSGVGKLIKNIEKFSSNINNTYVDIENVLKDFKKDNYEKITETISNLEKSTDRFSTIINSDILFYPEIEVTTTELIKNRGDLSKSKVEWDGSISLTLGKIYASKRGFKDLQKGYTIKWLKDLGPVLFSLGILENSAGAGIELIPFNYVNVGINAYDLDDWKIDLFGKFIINDIGFRLRYGIKTQQFTLGLGYKF